MQFTNTIAFDFSIYSNIIFSGLNLYVIVIVNGTVRHNFYSGLLEAYFGNWGYICDDYFDYAAADTVCRQLGYRGASVHSTYLYHNNYNFEVDNIRCLGNQFSINNCDFERTHDCGSYEHLAVQCDSGKNTNIGKIGSQIPF